MKYFTIKKLMCLLCVVSIWSSVSAATSNNDTNQEHTIFVRMISNGGIIFERINVNDIEENDQNTPRRVVRRPWALCADGSCSSD